jgi:hypothetical protein
MFLYWICKPAQYVGHICHTPYLIGLNQILVTPTHSMLPALMIVHIAEVQDAARDD